MVPGLAGHWANGHYLGDWEPNKLNPRHPGEHPGWGRGVVAFTEESTNAVVFLRCWMCSVHSRFENNPALIRNYRRRAEPPEPEPNLRRYGRDDEPSVSKILDAIDRLHLVSRNVIIFIL